MSEPVADGSQLLPDVLNKLPGSAFVVIVEVELENLGGFAIIAFCEQRVGGKLADAKR